MGNYVTDIIKEEDPVKRKENLDKLIAERTPSELLVLTAIAVLSDDSAIRKTALEHVDERNREEGNAAARVISLIQSWRREGALMTYPKPMDGAQNRKAAAIEAAFYMRSPLSSAAVEPASDSRVTAPSVSPASGSQQDSEPKQKKWWKFWA